jgi:hypothetical protein
LAVLLQLALPFAQAHAAESGADLSALICNPSGQPLSAEGERAVSELLSALGDAPEEGGETPPDCERCVTAATALPAPAETVLDLDGFPKPAPVFASSSDRVHTPVRGPPCGLRAPPTPV